jgi:hypothetical protein
MGIRSLSGYRCGGGSIGTYRTGQRPTGCATRERLGTGSASHIQRCQMAVVTATFQKYGSFKSWMAVDS